MNDYLFVYGLFLGFLFFFCYCFIVVFCVFLRFLLLLFGIFNCAFLNIYRSGVLTALFDCYMAGAT